MTTILTEAVEVSYFPILTAVLDSRVVDKPVELANFLHDVGVRIPGVVDYPGNQVAALLYQLLYRKEQGQDPVETATLRLHAANAYVEEYLPR